MIHDPVAASSAIEKARRANQAIEECERRVHVAARARRAAIEQALAAGMTSAQVAAALGMSTGRLSRLRR